MSLYGCETWFVILTETHKLEVLKNKVLRRTTKSGKQPVHMSVPLCRKPKLQDWVRYFVYLSHISLMQHSWKTNDALGRLNHVYGTGRSITRRGVRVQIMHRFYKYQNYTVSCLRRECRFQKSRVICDQIPLPYRKMQTTFLLHVRKFSNILILK